MKFPKEIGGASQMTKLKIRDIIEIDTISQDKVWKKIRASLPDDEVEIDFTSVDVKEPWTCPEFVQMFSSGKVRMTFTNNESLVNRLKIMARLSNIPDDYITNIHIEKAPVKTPEELKIEKWGFALIDYFVIGEDNVARFECKKKYTQIQNTTTIAYISKAIEKINADKGITTFVLDLNGIVVLANIVQSIVDMSLRFSESGINVLIDSNDKNVIDTYKLSKHNKTTTVVSNKERFNIFRENIAPETPCMIIKYKSSKAVDDYGRHGKGEIVSCRIGIFHNVYLSNGEFVVDLTAYRDSTFYTKIHWAVEHDNEVLKSMYREELTMSVDKIGFGSKFLGSDYHLLLPTQENLNENREVIYDIDENGRNIKAMCTIPERIKYVFDSWGIEYNKEALDKAIKETREHLYGSENN